MMKAYVGLGSNLGDRMDNLARAVEALADMPASHVLAVSHAYESEPWGQADQPRFANAVAVVDTDLNGEQLLDLFRSIEDAMGRDRSVGVNGPRVIDVDLLLLGDTEQVNDELVIPHPRLAERDFVVTPLLQVDPEVTWPDGRPITRDDVSVGAIVNDLGEVPDWGERTGEPLMAEDWEAVSESMLAQDMRAGFDARLQFARSVLESEGIPYSFWPFEPGVQEDPFGGYTVFKLLVPKDDAERAKAAIAVAEAAQPEFPDFSGDEASAEDQGAGIEA